MLMDRITKETMDISRSTMDMSWWLDAGETLTTIVSQQVIQGTTGWSEAPYPPPGSPLAYDPTPLTQTASLDPTSTQLIAFVSVGSPGLVYTCQYVLHGTSGRQVTIELGVQISGIPIGSPGYGPIPSYLAVTIAPNPPSDPQSGQLWFDSLSPELYIWYDDANSAQWVITTGNSNALSDAPVDGYVYGRQSAQWVNLGGVYLPLSGGTMRGPITLISDPITSLQPASKAYVDRQTAVGTPPGGPFLALAGGTMGGPLIYFATGGTAPRSVQDRAADFVNVLDFVGADPTGATDSTAAFTAALATGKNVYAPPGSYYLTSQLTVTAPQKLFGSGNATVILIDQGFSPSAKGVFWLQGAPGNTIYADCGPSITDLWISFAQPSDVTSRSTFAPLGTGTSGTGGTGVRYCPAVTFQNCGRFRLERLRFSNAWDGIVQIFVNSGDHSGGWWINDIEISAYSRDLVILDNLDFSHLKGWHSWAFGMVGQQHAIQEDGNHYGLQVLGAGLGSQALNISDMVMLHARVLLNSPGGWAHFSNLMLDGGSTIEHTNMLWTLISNPYQTGGSTIGAAAPIVMSGGFLSVVNMRGGPSSLNPTWVTQSGGTLSFIGGEIATSAIDQIIVSQSAGTLTMSGIYFLLAGGSAGSPWTIAPIQIAGVINFSGNFVHSYFLAPAGFISIATDAAAHRVDGNWPTTGYFIPPGPQGNYNIRRGPSNYNFGLQPTINASYGSGTNVTLSTVSAGGAIHMGSGAGAIIFDPNVPFVVGGCYCDSSLVIPANPTSGSTQTIPNVCSTFIIYPGSPLSSLTINMPAAPATNQVVSIATTQTITALTLSGNGNTINGAPTTLAANTGVRYIFNAGIWFRLQ